MIGQTFSHFKITAKLGEGGMGTVYQAEDTALGRDVAIKVLPEVFTTDPERLARFEREAKVLASLNHPSIITIFDVGETDGTSWVAMELVDGVTLEERIGQGPLALSKALEFAASIADGLAAAHQAGIVHRDLKPSNVMVAKDGFVKILDFGLAKLVPGSGDGGASKLQTETRPGQLIGTAAYMSPEQAAGKPADERADQFALGLVLYEMLTGRPAFREDTAAETLTAILRTEAASIGSLRPDTPAPLQWIAERCLAKDAEDRYAATADLARDLKHLVGRLSEVSRTTVEASAVSAGRHPSILPWVLAALLAATTFVAVWRPWSASQKAATAATKRFVIALPPGHVVASDYRPAVAVSPDGSTVVYAGRDPEGGRSLYVRAIGELESHPLPGTEGGSGPFFSPDGSWVGLFAYGKLKKVPLAGGTPITLADAPNSRGATWMPNDSIVFAPTFSSGLHRVPASGGAVETLSTPDPLAGEYSHRWPQWLPDDRTLVFVIWTRAPQLLEVPAIGLFDLESGSIRSLISDGEYATYSPSGHLLYTRQGRIHAVGFDLDALATVGAPRSITDVALVDHNTHAAHFGISHEGTLAYVPGSLTSERQLTWVGEGGVETPLDAPPRAYVGVRLSPDGRKIATSIESDEPDIWVYDIVSSALTRVTFESANGYPIWTPDGQFLTFSSNRAGGMNLFRVRADGTGEPQQLTEGASIAVPGAWSPDGRYLAYNAYRPSDLGADLWILPHEDGGEAYRYAGSGADERWAQFSPDGRWLAYVTNAAGLDQVYVGSFPEAGPLTQISIDGGRDPLWSADGDRLLYRNADEVWEISFDGSGSAPRIGRPRLVFEARYRRPPGPLPNYHLGPDGRFLMIKGGDAPGELDHLNVVLDWLGDITR